MKRQAEGEVHRSSFARPIPYAFAALCLLLSCAAPPPAHPEVAPPAAPSPAGKAIAPDLGAINDGKSWRVLNGDAQAAEESSRRVVHLSPQGGNRKGSNVAMALVGGLDFAEGTIEVDLKGSAAGGASFLGVAFRVAADGAAHEAVYFRPFNFVAEDPARRAHAVQYVSWPEHTWEKLREQTPGRYEAAVVPAPDPAGWFHARVEVGKEQVRVFVNDAPRPCLVVDRLGSPGKGGVGLWVDSQEGAFSGLRIVPAETAPGDRGVPR